jgi:NAD(P)H-hydrate epimerase
LSARAREAAWLFDGIAGTGLRGALQEPAAGLVHLLNASPGRKVAIDVPSGIGDSFRRGHPAFRADITLTMGLPKTCLYLPHARLLCGRILVVRVGFPPPLLSDQTLPGEMVARRAWRSLAPEVPLDAHKNTRGHLAVFAGSRGTTGAAWLCATAAARSRVGLVTLFVDSDAYGAIAPRCASLMCRPWDPPVPGAQVPWDPSAYSAVLVGPGWGLTREKAAWLDRLLESAPGGVLDADALSLLAERVPSGPDLRGRWVLTPHPGEFSRLTGTPRDEVLDDPVRHAVAWSGRLNATIVLKGPCTLIACPDGRFSILDAVNPALATGGSGDVLAGIVAAGMAGGRGPREAALFGVSLHAEVGRRAARRGWFLAEDLLPLISRTLC